MFKILQVYDITLTTISKEFLHILMKIYAIGATKIEIFVAIKIFQLNKHIKSYKNFVIF